MRLVGRFGREDADVTREPVSRLGCTIVAPRTPATFHSRQSKHFGAVLAPLFRVVPRVTNRRETGVDAARAVADAPFNSHAVASNCLLRRAVRRLNFLEFIVEITSSASASSRLSALRARLHRVATVSVLAADRSAGAGSLNRVSGVPREVSRSDDAYRVIIASDGTFVGELRPC